MHKATLSKERLAELARLVGELGKAHDALVAYRAECLSEAPVKIGDIVEVTGYSHRGKKMRVDHIALASASGVDWRFKATGRVLKKDDTPSLHSGEANWRVEGLANERG